MAKKNDDDNNNDLENKSGSEQEREREKKNKNEKFEFCRLNRIANRVEEKKIKSFCIISFIRLFIYLLINNIYLGCCCCCKSIINYIDDDNVHIK